MKKQNEMTQKEIDDAAKRLISREVFQKANTLIEGLAKLGVYPEFENVLEENEDAPEEDKVQVIPEYWLISEWLYYELGDAGYMVCDLDAFGIYLWDRSSKQTIDLFESGTFQKIVKKIWED